MIDYSKFTKEEIEKLKENYVLNECDTDEYEETQPRKGMAHISRALKLLRIESKEAFTKRNAGRVVDGIMKPSDEGSRANSKKWQPVINRCEQEIGELNQLLADWCCSITDSEDDCDSESDNLVPALGMVFDILMKKGEHPYDYTGEECREQLED